jgi:hypothetical protein
MTSGLVLQRPRVLFGSLLGWRQALGERLQAQGCEIAHSARIPRLLLDAAEENVLREASGELPEYVVNPGVIEAWQQRLERLASQPV